MRHTRYYPIRHRGRGGLFAIIPAIIVLSVLSGTLISWLGIVGIVILIVVLSSLKKSRNPYYGSSLPSQYNSQYNTYGSSPVPVNYTTTKHAKTGVYCYECGASLNGSERFCSTCGASQTL